MQFFADQFPYYVQDRLVTLVKFTSKSQGQWMFRCPICGDSQKNKRKSRGVYYTKTNSYHCFNCGVSCGAYKLLAALQGVPEESVKKDFVSEARKIDTSKRQPIPQVSEKKQEVDVLRHNADWTPSPLVQDFIRSRKLDEAPFKPANWELYLDSKKRRIVLPWVRDGEMKYFQLRAIDKDQTPKYLFPRDVEKSIFNIDAIDDSLGMIFMLEGAIDSAFTKNSIAIGGVSLTEHQNSLLENYFSSRILLLDNQNVDETARKKLEKIVRDHPEQKIFVWPKDITEKDVNEFYSVTGDRRFEDMDFLRSRVFSGLRALMEMRRPGG